MSWTRWLRALKPQLTSLRSRSRPARNRPAVESLEERSLFAVSIVSTADPSFLAAHAPVTTANRQSEIVPVNSISNDGTYTVYASTSTNLVANETANSPLTLNIYLYNSSNQTTTLISQSDTTPNAQANGNSFNPVISGDGSTVVFYSYASNLITGETVPSGSDELYLYNVSKGTLSMVSHTTTSATTGSNGKNPDLPALPGKEATILSASESGNTVTITTASANGLSALFPTQPIAITGIATSAYNGIFDATYVSSTKFTYTLGTSGLSTDTGGGLETPIINTAGQTVGSAINGTDYMGDAIPSVSSDGKYIAYISDAKNLGVTNTSGYTNVFLYDVAADTNTLVSAKYGASTTSASGYASTVALSSDGTTVAFTDPANNLISTNSGGLGLNDQLYVWSRTNNSTTGLSAGQVVLASHTAGTTSTALTKGTTIPAALQGILSYWTADDPPTLSANGAYVAYYDAGQDLVTNQAGTASVLNVFRYDVKNNSNTLVSHVAGAPATAGDNPQNQIAPPGLGPVEASGPQISSNGEFIAYANNSSNLISASSPLTTFGGTYDGRDNVYLYDAVTGNNTLVSHADGSTSTQDVGGGTAPSISANGRYVSYLDLAVPATPVFDQPFGSSITAMTESGSTVTVTTQTPLDLSQNDFVVISGADVAGYDGIYAVTSASSTTSNTFTFTSPQTGLAAGSTGIATMTGSGNVRLFDSQASSATDQPPIVGKVNDTKTSLFDVSGSLNPTVMSANTPTGDTLPVIAWDGLANDVVPGAVDVNSNIDVFEAISPASGISLTIPTGSRISTTTPTGTTVGTLSTNPAGSWTYSLVNITGVSNNNSLFSVSSSGTLTTATTFSVTTATTYTVSVQAFNTVTSTTLTQSFTITVYPAISSVSLIPSSTLVLNTSSTGTSFGTLTTTDPNPNQSFTYTLLSNTNLFAIGSNGFSIVTATTNITPGTYSVSVQTTDTIGLTLIGTVSITVYQIPTITSTGTTFTVGTNGSYTLTTTSYPSPTFTITTGTIPSNIGFNTSTGTFTGTAVTGTGGQYPLTITATNTAGTSPSTTFILTVNELPTVTSTGTTFTVGTLGTYALVTTGYPAPTSYTETGTLPANVGFNTSTGTFTGTPIAGTGGQYPVTVTATNSVGTSTAQTFVLTVNELPTVTSTGTTFTVGTQGSYTLVTTGYPAPTSYAESGTLPSNVSFNTSTGTFTGTPIAGTGGQYPVTVTATNSVGTSASQPFVLTVNEPPTVTSTTTGTTFTVGTLGSFTLVTAGYPVPTSYTETGTLPTNVGFNTTTGTFSGNPPAGSGGQYTLSVTATNSLGTSASQTVLLTVTEAPTVTSTGTTFTVGTQGSYALVTTGYPAPTSYTETGTLPANVSFNTSTGTFTGTPLAGTGGQYPVTVTATNSVATSPAQTFVLTVNELPTVTSTGATFTAGTQGTFALVTTGYPAPTSYTETGTLPTGVGFSNSTGTFTGKPAAGTGGQYTLSVTATNSVGTSASQPFVLTVNEAPTVTSTGTTFTVGTQGSYALVTTGYPAPTSYAESGTLPANVGFNTSTGTFTGTPLAGTGGQYTLSVTATNSVGTSASQTFVLTVSELPTVTSTGTTFTVGTQGSYALVATGSPTSYAETGTLPTGLGFSTSTGTFTGKPAAGTGGQYTLSVTATNSFGTSASQPFVLTVNELPTVTSTGTTFTVGTQGTYALVTTGYPAPTSYAESGTLPANVGFSTSTGTFTGTPLAGTGGQYPVTVTATNSVGTSATQAFVLTVTEAPTVTSTGTTFTVGTQGSYALVTTGYPTPTSYTETGTLPANVGFNTNTGTFTGTPLAGTGGQYPITVTATNSVGTSATQSFTLTVNELPTVTSTGTTFTVGTQGNFTLVTTGYPAPTSYAESGTLPSNVGFSTTTGKFTGTPLAGTGGLYPVTVTATNSVGTSATQPFVLTVNELPVITTTSLTLTVGSPSNVALGTTGYPAPTFTLTGNLPANVGFNRSTGTFTGTPAIGSGGLYPVTVTATNAVGTSSLQFVTITVDEAASITSTSTTFIPGQFGSFTLSTHGYPAPTFTLTGNLPTGIFFNRSTGQFTGTPNSGVAGTFTFTITATNGIGSTFSETFTLNIGTVPAFSSSTSAVFVAGATGGSFTVATSGVPAAALTESGDLPAGLSFVDNGDGTATISGTPSAGSLGSYSLTLQASNVVGSATEPFELTVVEPPTFSTASVVGFVVNENGTFTIRTSGTVDHLSESGALPAGLTFTDNGDGTATISGTPQLATIGTYLLTVTAQDGTSTVATQDLGLTVSGSATASEVNSVYFQLLGRSADPSGLSYFSGLVNSGAPLSTVVATITTSTEYRQQEVTSLYQQLLHRAPDPQGLAHFVGFLNTGGTLGEVGAAIVSSPEFVNANGGTPTSAMAALYEDALGRAIDPQGSATVNQDLQAGQSLFQVALMVFNSTEYHNLEVNSDYATYLGRTPDAAGLNYWSSVLNSGVSNEMVIALMLGDPSSQEFINRTSANPSQPGN